MKNMVKTLALMLALVLAVSLMAACSNGTQTSSSTSSQAQTGTGSAGPEWPATIKLAYIGPFTGNYSTYGIAKSNAIKMIVEEINSAGGIKSMGGAKLEFVYEDDKNDPKESVVVANKILADKSIVACIGPFSTPNGLAIKQLFNEAKIPLISTSISNPDFAKEVDYCFGAAATQADQMAVYGTFITKELGYKKAAVLWANNEWGQSVYDNFDKFFTAEGGEIVFQENYEVGTKDFKSQLTKVKNAGADFIYLGGHIAECGPIVNQMAELQIDLPILSSNSLQMQEYIDIVKENGEGQIMLSYFSPANDNPQAFEDYKAKFLAAFPETKSIDAHIFSMGDTMYMLREVLEYIGEKGEAKTPAEMAQAITDTIPTLTYQGMISEYTYNEAGQVKKPLVPVVLKDGKFATWTAN